MSQEVIIKEQFAKRSYRDILRLQIHEALQEFKRPTIGLFVSAIAAGLEVSFSVLLMATLLTLVGDVVPGAASRVIVAASYTIGFIFVILGRSELFTEHTTLAVLPVLNRRASFADLGRLWGVIWLGNVLGTFAFSFLLARLGPMLGVVEPGALRAIADPLIDQAPRLMFWSAVLAGWLMGLLSWLVSAARDTVGQIILVWLVTFLIGIAQLHHSIVGSTEVLSAFFAGTGIIFNDYLTFIFWSTLGNAAGGAFFVAFMKYRHATAGGRTGHSGI